MGHVFVLHADMRHLACDVVLVPVDDERRVVVDHWVDLVPESHRGPKNALGWAAIKDELLPDHRGRKVRLIRGTSPDGTPEGLALEAVRTLRAVSAERLKPRSGRAVPLIALPLVGTGDGGFRKRRGAVVKALLPALAQAATDIDVALVLRDERDYQAVQANRDEDWSELPPDLVQQADDLGALASRGALSLFLGAGVSYPAGAPLWAELIAALRDAAPSPPQLTGNEIADATALEASMDRAAFEGVLTEKMGDLAVAPAHALLAALGPQQVVTTNYDLAFERALDATTGVGGYRVLARELPEQPAPYVLKLHGDIDQPDSVVLTQAGYDRVNKGDLRALTSVVDALLHTGHLLFVGYSMKDLTFVESVKRVADVRRIADSGLSHRFATVLALHEGEVQETAGMRVVPMSPKSERDSGAGRRLEVFLDRLAWAAARGGGRARWLMHPAYEDLLSEDDRQLVNGLSELIPHLSGTSVGRSAIRDALTALGHVPAS